MIISQEDFKNALGCFASGVTVVTMADADGTFGGITVSAFCSVSLDPPLILVCIDKNSVSHETLVSTGAFVVNILGEDQKGISQRFATALPDKFVGLSYIAGIKGIPVLEGAIANLECDLRNTYDGGDHSIFIGEVRRITQREGRALVYCDGDYRVISKRGDS